MEGCKGAVAGSAINHMVVVLRYFFEMNDSKEVTSFDQNLGEWHITIDSTSIDGADVLGVVGTISARNAFLDGQNLTYVIEPDSD